MRRFIQRTSNMVLFPQGLAKKVMIIFIAVLLPAIYCLVYTTGGIKYVYSHTMYIPIVLAGIIFGIRGGALAAIAAGLLLGPLMPIDTLTGEEQQLINWFYRMGIFVILGTISGVFFDVIRKKITRITELLTHNPDTAIPNTGRLSLETHLDEDIASIVSIMVNNYNNIVNSLGKDVFVELMKGVYERITHSLPNARVLQSDSSKLCVCLYDGNCEYYLDLLTNILRRVFVFNDIPMYLDISLGAAPASGGFESIHQSLQKADIAAHYAQQNNLGYSVFDESQMTAKRCKLELLGRFPKALQTNQTELYFQPKIDLETKRPVGVEALIRWKPSGERVCESARFYSCRGGNPADQSND